MAAFADGIRVAESRRRAERMMLLLLQLQLVIYLLEQVHASQRYRRRR